MSAPEDAPNVVAWRVGQLEKTQKEGFDGLNDKLDDMIKGFVTEKEMSDMLKAKAQEHAEIWAAINGIKTNAKWWVTVILTVVGLLVAYFAARG